MRLADEVWKGVRDDALEQEVAGAIANQQNIQVWEVFMYLDDLLSAVASEGDLRLAWQGRTLPMAVYDFPVKRHWF